MKIGILTFHSAHNYGAVLQCYALQTYLLSLHHEVFVLDYNQPEVLRCYRLFDIRRFRTKNPVVLVKKIAKEFLVFSNRKARSANFETFIKKRLHLLPLQSEYIQKMDAIVIGSDQVWNTKLTYGFSPMYWGQFPRNPQSLLLSYAASIEQYWEERENDRVIRYLSKFDAVSVREKEAAEKLKGLLNRDVSEVVDPTLLLESRDWEKIVSRPQIDEPYLLLYQVRPSKKAYKIARIIAKKKNLRLLCLSAAVDALNSEYCASASPELYLGLFKYASFVVCTSFHGTVFSITFSVPFYSIRLDDGRDERVSSLLNSMGLSDRFVSEYIEEQDRDINFKQVHARRDLLVKESKLFLDKYLGVQD